LIGLEFYSPDRKFPALPQAVVDQVNELNSTDSSVHFTARLFEYLKSANTPVTVIATGPLTNIALLLINYPRVTKYIKK
jgi:inosine-uridine nucleoside N-ribohydrolase